MRTLSYCVLKTINFAAKEIKPYGKSSELRRTKLTCIHKIGPKEDEFLFVYKDSSTGGQVLSK